MKEKHASPFIIYGDFESILVAEDKGKPNPDEYYTNKYQKHVACSYEYKLVYIDDKFSKSFKSYLGKDRIYSFIKSMMDKSRYFNEKMKKKKNNNKELVMIKERDEI